MQPEHRARVGYRRSSVTRASRGGPVQTPRSASGRRAGAPPWEFAAIDTAVVVGLVVWRMPPPQQLAPPAPAMVSLAEVKAVLDQSCALCHIAQVQQKNVALHTQQLIKQHALAVYQQAVVLKLMPLNNATWISDAKRAESRKFKRPFSRPCPGVCADA